MSGEDTRDFADQGDSRQVDDDEPTLETDAPVEDDDPTLETEDDTQENTLETQRPRPTTWGSRLEQMTAARRERRRRVINRFWLAAAPVLILLAVAVVLLAVYGGQGGGGGVAVDTTGVSTPAAAEGSAVLLIEVEGSLSTVVLLQPWDGGGVVMAAPGVTLLDMQGVFRTLAQTHEDDGPEAVKVALSEAFALPLGPVAVVDRQALQTALSTAGIVGLPAEVSASVQSEAAAVAEAVRSLVGYTVDNAGAWDEAGLRGGDASDFLRAVRLDAVSMAEDVWTPSALTGRVVDGDGFSYLEPDIATARSLLVVEVESAVISVEIRDGAGIEGAARSAGELLAGAGFVLAPMSYAQAYPNVETTQILASAADSEYAQQIALALGLGQIVEDDQVELGRVVVVLGKDFGVEPAPTTVSTD